MEIVDLTGEPRSDKEIAEAIKAIKEVMIKYPLTIPILTVHAGIIKDALEELLERRHNK